MKPKSLLAVVMLGATVLAPAYGATITSLRLDGGSFSGTFSSSGQEWDTIYNGTYILGVSSPGLGNPLLNAADTSIDIAAGTYYIYNSPTNFGTAVQITATWSDLRPADVAVFEVASLSSATPWTRLAGATTMTLASTGITNLDIVGTFDHGSPLNPDGIVDNVLAFTIRDANSDVPEPATFALLGFGLCVSVLVGRRARLSRLGLQRR